MRDKQPMDVRDIRELLNLAVDLVPMPDMETEEGWLPNSFVTAARRRVRRFEVEYPDTSRSWRRLGLKSSSSTVTSARTRVRTVDDITSAMGSLYLRDWSAYD
jgi:hypothetical protein